MTRSRILSVLLVLTCLAAASTALASDGTPDVNSEYSAVGADYEYFVSRRWTAPGDYFRRAILYGHARLRKGAPHCGALHSIQLRRQMGLPAITTRPG